MKVNYMKYKYSNFLICITVVFLTCCNSAFADEVPGVSTSVEKGVCSIKIDEVVIDNYKCEYYYAPSVLSYSYLYEADKQILVFIDRPMGNACDGGPLHVFIKEGNEKFKSLKIIDFCGCHYPSITSGPENFKISIPLIPIDGTSKKIPAETWELKKEDLVKK